MVISLKSFKHSAPLFLGIRAMKEAPMLTSRVELSHECHDIFFQEIPKALKKMPRGIHPSPAHFHNYCRKPLPKPLAHRTLSPANFRYPPRYSQSEDYLVKVCPNLLRYTKTGRSPEYDRDIILCIEFSIPISQKGNPINPLSCRCHCMEEFGVLVPIFMPFDSRSLYLVDFLLSHFSEKLLFNLNSSVHFFRR